MNESFLRSVWEAQEAEGYVFVSYKLGDSWTDVPITWPCRSAKLSKTLAEIPKKADVYFCPTVFSGPRRLADLALPSVWLHADLDEVDPVTEVDEVLAASTAWQTSRGRYQCMWRMTRPVSPKAHRALNRRLTYATGADKGGWSITKALRVPGTRNYKRSRPELVTLLWEDQQHYLPRVVKEAVADVRVRDTEADVPELRLPNASRAQIIRKYKLRARTKQLIHAKTAPVGERSERLWELECTLLEAGMTPEECFVVVRGTVWNKYQGQRREIPQLWAEVCKAVEKVGEVEQGASPTKTGHVPGKLQLMHYSKFMGSEVAQKLWAVEGIWSDEAHGFIAGEPKTFKSFIATDLAVAVASGSPFLGQFEVPAEGPVIMIQEENTPGMMKDRLEKIAAARGLLGEVDGDEVVLPDRLPIFMANNAGLDLTDEDCIAQLDELIGDIKPKLVVLDPLYMMIPGINESNQAELTPILRSLLTLKQKHDTGLLIVHHYNKPRDNEDRHPGNRLSGSGVLYRWFESVIYLEKLKTPGQVKMSTEHRGHAPGRPMHLQFDIGDMGELDYYVDVQVASDGASAGAPGSIREAYLDRVRTAGREGVKLSEVCDELGVSRQYGHTLGKRLKKQVRMATKKTEGERGRPPVWLFWREGS